MPPNPFANVQLGAAVPAANPFASIQAKVTSTHDVTIEVTSTHDVTVDILPPRRVATDPVRPTREMPPLVTRAPTAITKASGSGGSGDGLSVRALRARLSTRSLLNSPEVFQMFGPTFYCQICLCNRVERRGVALSCGHRFCSDCILNYVTAKVQGAQVVGLKCPYVDDELMALPSGDGWSCAHCTFFNSPFGNPDEQRVTCSVCQTEQERPPRSEPGCATLIDRTALCDVLRAPPELLQTYDRFVAIQTDKKYRECPSCGEPSVVGPTRWSNQLTCARCGLVYCFAHANAHPGRGCRQFERAQRREVRARRRGGGEPRGVATRPLHACRTHVTHRLHTCYTAATRLLHACYTRYTPVPHACATRLCHTPATRRLHTYYRRRQAARWWTRAAAAAPPRGAASPIESLPSTQSHAINAITPSINAITPSITRNHTFNRMQSHLQSQVRPAHPEARRLQSHDVPGVQDGLLLALREGDGRRELALLGGQLVGLLRAPNE